MTLIVTKHRILGFFVATNTLAFSIILIGKGRNPRKQALLLAQRCRKQVSGCSMRPDVSANTSINAMETLVKTSAENLAKVLAENSTETLAEKVA